MSYREDMYICTGSSIVNFDNLHRHCSFFPVNVILFYNFIFLKKRKENKKRKERKRKEKKGKERKRKEKNERTQNEIKGPTHVRKVYSSENSISFSEHLVHCSSGDRRP